jgi:hypothetical protein
LEVSLTYPEVALLLIEGVLLVYKLMADGPELLNGKLEVFDLLYLDCI